LLRSFVHHALLREPSDPKPLPPLPAPPSSPPPLYFLFLLLYYNNWHDALTLLVHIHDVVRAAKPFPTREKRREVVVFDT
jgi:hypothetical protein